MKKLVLAAAALLASTAMPASAAEFITNGNFSGATGFTTTGNVGVASGQDYVTFAAGDGSPTARANRFASFGSNNLAGLGTVAFQSFGTVLGQIYTLSFDYGAFNATNQQLSYTLNGVPGTVLTTPAGTSNLDVLFTNFTTTFTGTGALTTLEFQSTSTLRDNADILLDNVSVTSVPEPATWAMMLIGFGMVGAGIRGRRKLTVQPTYA